MKPFLFLFLAGLILSGCAKTAADYGAIMPKGGGSFVVVSQAQTEQEAQHRAMKAADMTCRERGSYYAVDEIETAYNGMVSEKTNQAVDMLASVALLAGAPMAMNARTDEDYKTTVKFRCE